MEEFEKIIVKKVVKEIEDEINKLELINTKNVEFIETANKNSESKDIIEWALSAKENKSLLEELKSVKAYFEEKYMSK